ncbi:DUF6020 family protein [Microbacterium album]|uniref:Uncharacterized protein n=1 Tax=Microbacterium album TaxID=2053191 RepID=A0A917IC77_9MICO|nr:DUF6020 family protein [Microbacterium album]GGH37549.1 hypothetical protein GCM10010921_07490 [Microbacterium album]
MTGSLVSSARPAASGAPALWSRVAAVGLPVVVIAVLALYATAGWLRREFALRHGNEGYPLFSELIAADPLRPGLVFLLVAAGYTAVFFALRWLVARASGPVGTGLGRTGRAAKTVDWVFARWWRLSLALLVLWAPLLALRWPGAVNPDFALMVTEIAQRRSEFPGDAFKPYDIYPIAYHLLPAGDLIWSNQHNAFLTLIYGGMAGVSGAVFQSYIPGVVVLTTGQALFTVFALGRALALAARHVERRWVKVAGLALTAGSVMTPLWSMDLSKNPLFAAAVVWWLALLLEFAFGHEIRRRWGAEVAAATVVVLVSVKFGVYVAALGLMLLLITRRRPRLLLAALLTPILVFVVLLRGLMVAGLVIPDDSVETRVVQLQQMALTLREHPDALDERDRARLERVFDIEAMTRVYDPDNADPVKSSGLDDNGSYRWRTVSAEDWSHVTGIWARLGARYPALYVDAFLLKSHRYLDIASESPPWPPLRTITWSVTYSLDLTGVNDGGRELLASGLAAAHREPVLRLVMSASAWAVATILLCTVAISLRRPRAALYALPLALQAGVALLSPLNGAARYLLGLVYAAGLVFMALGMRDGTAHTPAPLGSERSGAP